MWGESTGQGGTTANMFCMVRHQPPLARYGSPQAFCRSWYPGPHCSKGCTDVSLVVSAHKPMFSARHFPLGVSGHCSLGVPGLPGGPHCRAASKGMVLPVCKLQHQFKQLNPTVIQKVLGGPGLGGTKRVNFQERTLQTPCHTAAAHLWFIKSAFLCGNKEKA